ncbi:hypothetical protein C2845_PM18G01360 [Panicum miliaceum]|uniref:DUF4220 domain-containing protein n=1 Tax=Panicum miliaceum TaxID=4540 RepID=A0A3L6PHQ7_PANMI|nr:hypothetical protein C2845_PM18G01360 [Panicum miliaceum]
MTRLHDLIDTNRVFLVGIGLAKLLLGEDHPLLDDVTPPSDLIWETLALVWVRMLVYAAPYGNAEAHMQCLSQGGEFITHLWALLYHIDIREWKLPNKKKITRFQRIIPHNNIGDEDNEDYNYDDEGYNGHEEDRNFEDDYDLC